MTSPEFTGERFIPGQGGAQIAYEHLHRYAFAARWARGKRVLDVATGSGYGAALLARIAAQVWAADIDAASMRGAAEDYGSGNILYLAADATCLPFSDRSMDLVVAFEVLEHLRDQAGLISELARVAAPKGVVLISTPNKATYSDARGYTNPYHVAELYREDLVRLLSANFTCVRLLHQQVRAGSLMLAGEPGEHPCEVMTMPAPDPSRAAVEPMYFVAICRHEAGADAAPSGSAYVDLTDALFEELRSELRAAVEEIRRLNNEIERLGTWGHGLEVVIKERDTTVKGLLEAIQALEAEMRVEIGKRDRVIVDLQQQFEERTRWALSLEKDVSERDNTIRIVSQALDEAAEHLARIRHALLYRLLRRLRFLPD